MSEHTPYVSQVNINGWNVAINFWEWARKKLGDFTWYGWLWYHRRIQRGKQGVRTVPGKSQVAIGFLKISGTDPSREAIGPDGSNCFSREVRTALVEISWLLRNWLSGSPLKELSGSARDTRGKQRKRKLTKYCVWAPLGSTSRSTTAYVCEESPNYNLKWASTRENMSSGDCEQQRRKPACASAQYHLRLSEFVIRLLESIIYELATSEIMIF